jgi:hypothetical protein
LRHGRFFNAGAGLEAAGRFNDAGMAKPQSQDTTNVLEAKLQQNSLSIHPARHATSPRMVKHEGGETDDVGAPKAARELPGLCWSQLAGVVAVMATTRTSCNRYGHNSHEL